MDGFTSNLLKIRLQRLTDCIFFRFAFPNYPETDIYDQKRPSAVEREELDAKFIKDCDALYAPWCKKVMGDWEENAEFKSDAQMDKFKSRVLRGMVESSGKIDQMTLQIAKDAKANQEQVNALSVAVQLQHSQMQQLHASVETSNAQIQLILQKLNA
jgi:hypothetical protein